jgi:hypothetical protein
MSTYSRREEDANRAQDIQIKAGLEVGLETRTASYGQVSKVLAGWCTSRSRRCRFDHSASLYLASLQVQVLFLS